MATGGSDESASAANAGSNPGTAGSNAAGASGGSVAGAGAGGPSAPPGPDPGTDGDGDFMAGPTYTMAADLQSKGNPAGKTFTFTLRSQDSKIFTGLDTTLTAPAAFSRSVSVYVPAKFKVGTPAPVMVVQDGGGTPGVLVKAAVDNLSISTDPARRLPAFVVVFVANGGGDGKGSERGLEYDTMSDRYARFIDTEVLPAAAANAQLQAAYPGFTFTKDPEGRGAVGCSSGAAAAFTMGWFRPDLFRRVIAYSATLVAQQDDDAPEKAMFPDGAWDYHSDLGVIANTAELKPVRMMINANSMDNGYNAAESGKHNWLMANQRTAAALKSKGYHYRFVLGQGLSHCAREVEQATMAESLLWVWRGYPNTP
jgi:enterochelin esterase-like enzyme